MNREGKEMHPNIVDDFDSITRLLESTHRIAVLGIKTEDAAEQAAFYVPKVLADMGYEIVPVPVYYPTVTEILGRKVYRRVADVPGPPLDLVNVFRRSKDLMPHLSDLLAAKPRAVWLQQGIRDDAFALELAKADILVVQDRCLMVDARMRPRRPRE